MTSLTRIEAEYLIEPPLDPRVTAEAMAGEQSSGTFVAVPGVTPELKARAAARVETIRLLEDAAGPSLPVARPMREHGPGRPAHVELSCPVDRIRPSLP